MLSRLFKHREKPVYPVRLEPYGVALEVREGTTVLDAALDRGLEFPHSCRVGGCGTCRCRLVSGEVKQLTDSSYVLPPEDIEAGYVLGCQSTPRGPVTIELPDQEMPIVETAGTVRLVEELADGVLRVHVNVDEPLLFRPGQYANLSVPGIVDRPRSYSFSAAGDGRRLRFDVRVIPNGALSSWFSSAKAGAGLSIKGPYGSFYLRESERPLVAIAGGTGLGPVLAIIQSMVSAGLERDLTVIVGARNPSTLYGTEELESLLQAYPGKSELRVVFSEHQDASEQRQGWTFEHLDGVPSGSHAYLCGPPAMIDGALPVLEAREIRDIYFDKFLDTSGSAPLRTSEKK
ncbi:MAG: 2Fe-2S iron-sulfur cluster binding domain-containing protein [Myxococcota bacterium]